MSILNEHGHIGQQNKSTYSARAGMKNMMRSDVLFFSFLSLAARSVERNAWLAKVAITREGNPHRAVINNRYYSPAGPPTCLRRLALPGRGRFIRAFTFLFYFSRRASSADGQHLRNSSARKNFVGGMRNFSASRGPRDEEAAYRFVGEESSFAFITRFRWIPRTIFLNKLCKSQR